jgi:UDP-4-keto-D-FucNAc 4-reductase
MKVLVTGASGFIGRYLCKCLADNGHEVIALVRMRGDPIEGAKQEKIVSEFDDFSSISNVLGDCDALIHLAGRAHVLNDTAISPLNEFRRVNVGMTEKIILEAAKSGVRRFVFVSSIGVNGNRNIGRPFVESDIEDPHDLYAVSKLEAEQVVKRVAIQAGMEYVIVRPALVFGPNAPGNFSLLLKLASKPIPLPFRGLSAKRNLLSIWNMVDFLKTCINHSAALQETFLVADEQTVTLPDIFKILGLGMGKRKIIFSVPSMVIAGACNLFRRSEIYDKLDSQLTIDISKAKNILNWDPPYSTIDALIKTGKEYIGKQK